MLLKNGHDLLIKRADVEEAAPIIAYLNSVGGESNNLSYGANDFGISFAEEEQYIKKTNMSKTSILLVGKINDEIVSIGSLTSPTRERLLHNSELNISVRKRYWGFGIGRLMIESLIDYAVKTEIIKVIRLCVNSDNLHAIALYEKVGFQKIGVQKKYLKINNQYKDSVLMNLFL